MNGAAPIRLRLSRTRGFRLQAHSRAVNGRFAVNVARPGPLGNPFVVGRDGTHRQCVNWYQRLLSYEPQPLQHGRREELIAARSRFWNRAASLADFNLACWCPLAKPGEEDCCHASVQLRYVRRYVAWGVGLPISA